MKRNLLLIITVLTLLLSACNTSITELTSANGASTVLAQEAEPTDANTTDANEKDDDADEEVARPEGWSEDTHDKSADPDYDVVFPQDEVNRIDIVIEPENWQAMMDDMASLYGNTSINIEGAPAAGEMIRPEVGVMPEQDAEAPAVQPGGGMMMPGVGTMPEQGSEAPAGQLAGGGRMRPGGGTPPEQGQIESVQPSSDGDALAGQTLPDDQQPPQEQGERPTRQGGRSMGQGGNAMGGGGMMTNSSENPIYVPVTINFEDDTWTNVGLRFKGNSSLRSTWNSGNLKLPLRLDFDQFEDEYPEIDDQRFYGFEQLTFSSNFNDASFLREKVTADIFREAGVPAAQTAFYEVYVDYGEGPVYFGLYTAVEVVDDTVIETQFEDDDGNVYKPEGSGASFAAGTFSEAAFEKQTNKDEGDWSDIEAVFDALHASTRTSDPATWRTELEAVFDADGFLNWLAVNTVVQNWDTYGGMTHNYYLYHDPTTDQIVWIPWDNNEALQTGKRSDLSLSMDEVGNNWPLIRYLLDDEVYYAQYMAYVDAVIDTAFDPEEMEATYRDLAEMIEPYVLAENAEHTLLRSDASFYVAIEELVEHAYERYAVAAAFVAGQ